MRRPDAHLCGEASNPSGNLATAIFGVLTGPENQWLDGYTQQWSLSVDQEIGKSLVVEAQYLGSKGTHIESSLDYNATAPGSASLQNRLP